MFANSSKMKLTIVGNLPLYFSSARRHKISIDCHIMIACRNEKVLSVSDMMAKTAVRCPGSPISSRFISSYFNSSRTCSIRIGAMRTLQLMMMDFSVLPAATLNIL